jgi:hypothetical protein
MLSETNTRSRSASTGGTGAPQALRRGVVTADAAGPRQTLSHYIGAQAVNSARHARAVRAFDSSDFGDTASAPRTAHLKAVNALLAQAGAHQGRAIALLQKRAARAAAEPTQATLRALNYVKALAEQRTQITEKIWLFYLHLFEQRLGPFGDKLLAMDRIALDCYQACYMGLGKARSIPTPPPFSYVEAGYGPATYRRGVLVSRIARNPNPFPLVKLPYTRLINPWSLGAVPHEIGHNLQNDLDLWKAAPGLINEALRKKGVPESVTSTWRDWHKETYADLIGVLLIGPAYVMSLMDVVGKPDRMVARFRQGAVHPTSFLRVLINCHLLGRIGFAREATRIEAAWRALYPASVEQDIPAEFRRHFPVAMAATVDALCFQPNAAYGGRRLVDVVRYRQQDAAMVSEAARRLAMKTNPGILPERFLIAAVREALDLRLAPPETLTDAFYITLLGR